MTTRDLDRPSSHHARAGRRHLQHLLERDHVELAGGRDEARVGGEDAAHVGVDLAVGAERSRERDRGRVRAAASQRRDVVVGRDTLEPRDEDDLLLVESLVDPPRADVDDLRLAVGRVRDDPGLRSRQRDRLVAEVVDGHRAECVRDPLADRDQHVELARVGPIRDPAREVEQLIRRVPHRGEHPDDAVPRLARRDQSSRHVLDHLGVGERRPAELHHDGAALRLSSEDGRDRFVLDRRHRFAERSRELGCRAQLARRKRTTNAPTAARLPTSSTSRSGPAAAGSWSTASSTPTNGRTDGLGLWSIGRDSAVGGGAAVRDVGALEISDETSTATTAGSVHARTTGAAGLRTGRTASSATASSFQRTWPEAVRSPIRYVPVSRRFRPTVPLKRKAFDPRFPWTENRETIAQSGTGPRRTTKTRPDRAST